ncbi:MAG: TonB-dependent receptor [Bacteroidales bacterium]|nr:TonB-dependent receptor [Bacteroidales bacterium]
MTKWIFKLLSGLILHLLFSPLVFSQQEGQVSVTGSYIQTDLISLFTSIETQYPVKLYYKKDWFSSDTITLTLREEPIEEVLNRILKDKPYTYKIFSDNQIVFLPKQAVADITKQRTESSMQYLLTDNYKIIGNPAEMGKYRTVDVTGVIRDGTTGEPVIGTYVQIEDMLQGTVSSTDGTYKLTLNPGLYSMIISSLGYETSIQQVRIVSHGSLDIELYENSIEIEDVIIYGQRLDKNVTSHQMSLIELDTRTIKKLPFVTGERDIIKGLTSMPGINSVGEFSSGINVRGGGEDQNLYLINEAPLFNTSHVFGLLSVVNPDIVDQLTLYKGHIPASFGERISSVIDIRTRETIPSATKIQGGIGLFDSKLMMELPIVKDKVFLNLGGRSLYSNWLLRKIDEADLRNSKAFFYDLNAALNINTKKSRILVSAYTSFDDFTFNDEVRYAYGNTAGSLIWNYLINSKVASYLSLSFSDYEAKKDDIHDDFAGSRTETGITYSGLRYSLKYSGIERNLIETGINIFGYSIQPGKLEPLDEKSLVLPATLEAERGIEGAVFLNDEMTLNRFLTVNAGIRFSGYRYLGPKTLLTYLPDMPRDSTTISGRTSYGKNEIIRSYYMAEPRLSARIKLNQKSSVKFSFNRNIQYLALISNSSVSTPGDVWKLSDPYTRPLVARQFAIGYYRNFMNNTIESSAELYFKNLSNIIEYKKGAEIEMAANIERQLIDATGRNYGVEILVKKNTGKIDGWITYTFSRSIRKTTGKFRDEILNNGNYFPSSFDKPHNLIVVANYNLNRRIIFSANFTYSTGRPITLPEYKYNQNNVYLVYYSEKNKYRMPAYHRLDFTMRINESLRIRKKWKGSWSFSILNIYGRKNAYTIFYKKERPNLQNDFNGFSLYKLYLIGKPILTITYNFIF